MAGDDPVDYPVNEQVATHLQQIADCSERGGRVIVELQSLGIKKTPQLFPSSGDTVLALSFLDLFGFPRFLLVGLLEQLRSPIFSPSSCMLQSAFVSPEDNVVPQ